MTSAINDVTAEFNTNNGFVSDVSGWDTVSVQFVSPTGTISITGTNDGGATPGVTFGDATTATNFAAIQATKLSDGTAVTTVAATGIYKITRATKYVKFGGAAAAATKILVFLSKTY